MKTLFVSGFFPRCHQAFFLKLCQQFRVICFRECGFAPTVGAPFTFLEDIIPANQQQPELDSYLPEFYQGLQFVETELKQIFGDNTQKGLQENEIQDLHKIYFQTYGHTHLFKQLLNLEKIDLVLICSDYDHSMRRSIVIEARKHCIKTVNIEHGNFSVLFPAEIYAENTGATIHHASDYVIVDNAFELEFFYGERRRTERSQYLVKGTPVDTNMVELSNRETAFQHLGLDPARPCITYLGTWWEGRSQSQLVRAQMEDALIVGEFLNEFASYQIKTGCQLIVKLHPAFSGPEQFADIKQLWNKKAEQLGCTVALVKTDQLMEILSITDVLVIHGNSSLLWDALLAKIPAICYYGPWFQEQFVDPQKTKTANPLYQQGMIKVALSIDEIFSDIDHFMDPVNRQEYENKVNALKENYKLETLTLDQKTDSICRWIKQIIQ